MRQSSESSQNVDRLLSDICRGRTALMSIGVSSSVPLQRSQVRYTNTKQQIADLMTKAQIKPDTRAYLLDLAQIRKGELPEEQRVEAKALATEAPWVRRAEAALQGKISHDVAQEFVMNVSPSGSAAMIRTPCGTFLGDSSYCLFSDC